MAPSITTLLASIGAIYTTARILTFFRTLNRLLLHRSTLSRYISSNTSTPSWALITGASDGVGKGFAQELLERGFNVLLHGRNKAKLEALQTTFQEAYPARTISIAIADASSYEVADLDKIAQQVSSLPDGGRLRVLINNVGGAGAVIGKPICHTFAEMTGNEVDTLINVNARFPARLTNALMPVLTQSPSLIINIGSMAGQASLPYLVMYNAVKAFNLSFSTGLAEEMKYQGHDVQVIGVVLGPTDTVGAPAAEPDTPGSLEPRVAAAGILDGVGNGEALIDAHWKHWGMRAISTMVPQSAVSKQMHESYLKTQKKV
ncbi:NAD(P)-binding protein [Microthyrium microscopicum]|uniref:NAD(P)-binding protein n=1 Tax=Microthyrium microscopicum TaxID=703497 RepID=A0A6A6U7N4_9PEZI|nr:NAD(P)-binding protein [Microthyrium microscopicum]